MQLDKIIVMANILEIYHVAPSTYYTIVDGQVHYIMRNGFVEDRPLYDTYFIIKDGGASTGDAVERNGGKLIIVTIEELNKLL
jgi:hypothetical protein